jgi:hypothetical protein
MAATVFECRGGCAIFPSIPFGSISEACSFCAAVSKRRCTVSTSAGRLRAFFSQRPTESLITAEGEPRVRGWDSSALFREASKTGFPASNASSFFARAKRRFRVSFGFADFFRFDFGERIERAPRLFDCRFFFAIYLLQGGTPQFVETNHTADKVFFPVSYVSMSLFCVNP